MELFSPWKEADDDDTFEEKSVDLLRLRTICPEEDDISRGRTELEACPGKDNDENKMEIRQVVKYFS